MAVTLSFGSRYASDADVVVDGDCDDATEDTADDDDAAARCLSAAATRALPG